MWKKKGYFLECSNTGYVVFSEQHRTFVNPCESIVYGDRVKDYPQLLAEILDMGSDPDQNCENSENIVVLQSEQVPEPSTFREVMAPPESDFWEGAIREELDSLIEMDTWVHKIKLESDGSIRFKSRLVVKGFNDTNKYSISEIFAPVARLGDVSLFLSVVNKLNRHLYQSDVTTAFLHGTLEKPVFMEIPEGLVELTDVSIDLKQDSEKVSVRPQSISKIVVCEIQFSFA